jgi:hypothetical protein
MYRWNRSEDVRCVIYGSKNPGRVLFGSLSDLKAGSYDVSEKDAEHLPDSSNIGSIICRYMHTYIPNAFTDRFVPCHRLDPWSTDCC